MITDEQVAAIKSRTDQEQIELIDNNPNQAIADYITVVQWHLQKDLGDSMRNHLNGQIELANNYPDIVLSGLREVYVNQVGEDYLICSSSSSSGE